MQSALLVGVALALHFVSLDASLLDWLQVVLLVIVGSTAFILLGFAVSGTARSEESVPAQVQAVSFAMMFLSGVFGPSMPSPASSSPSPASCRSLS